MVGWFLLVPSEYQDSGGLAFAESFLSSNVFLWRTTDFFGNAAEQQPLLYDWSLATEEQFYLIFPVALLLRLKVGRKHLASVICCVWDFSAKPNRDRFQSEMRQGISHLISNGTTAILVRDVARQNVHPGPALLAYQLLGRSPHTIGRQKKSHQDEVWKTESILVEIAEEFPEVVVRDPAESLCGNADIWPVSHQSRLVYRDSDHLSSYGSLLLKPHFSESFDLLISTKLPDRTSSDRQGRTP